jgi:hypothetical protein
MVTEICNMSGSFHSYQDDPSALKSFVSVEYDQDKLIGWIRFLIESEKNSNTRYFSLVDCLRPICFMRIYKLTH